jgi:hypothetical protein
MRTLSTCEEAPEARVTVFLSTHTEHVPPALQLNLKHNKVLHRTVLLVRVATDNIPRVAGPDRMTARELGCAFWQIDAHFGFAQTPNVPRELCRAEIPGLDQDLDKVSSFVGRANIKSTPRPRMAAAVRTGTSSSRGSRRGRPSSSGSVRIASSNSAPRSISEISRRKPVEARGRVSDGGVTLAGGVLSASQHRRGNFLPASRPKIPVRSMQRCIPYSSGANAQSRVENRWDPGIDRHVLLEIAIGDRSHHLDDAAHLLG